MILARGDITTMLSRPVTAFLLGSAAVMLVVVISPSIARKREEVFSES